jgi:high-affinity iron transporter
VAPGTVQSALITGVLGIPADPRRIEIIGWLAFIVPISIFVYSPQAWRPGPRAAAPVRLWSAAALVVVALGLVVFYPSAEPRLPADAPIFAAGAAGQSIGTIGLDASGAAATISLTGTASQTLLLPDAASVTESHAGVAAASWTLSIPAPTTAPATLSIDDVMSLAGGRIPVGLNLHQDPGPFTATWSAAGLKIWAVDGSLLDASATGSTVVTLTGGGLATPRTITVNAAQGGWTVDPAYRDAAATALGNLGAARAERQFWAFELPTLLGLAAVFLAFSASRILRRARADAVSSTKGGQPAAPLTKGTPRAAQ